MTTPEDFERRLAEGMTRAGEPVTGDGVTLDGVAVRHRERVRARRFRRGAVAAVAAGVLAVTGIGVALGSGDGGTTQIAANAGPDTGSSNPTSAPTTVPCDEPGLIIFLEPAVTEAQREAIVAALESDPRIESFRYVGQAEAYQEARELFADQPVTRDLLEEEDVPPSFRVVVADDGLSSALWTDLANLDGVRDVVDNISGRSHGRAEAAGRLSPEQIEALVDYLDSLETGSEAGGREESTGIGPCATARPGG